MTPKLTKERIAELRRQCEMVKPDRFLAGLPADELLALLDAAEELEKLRKSERLTWDEAQAAALEEAAQVADEERIANERYGGTDNGVAASTAEEIRDRIRALMTQ